MTHDVYELFDGMEAVQGWDINTMLHLACCFIGSREARVELFRDFLKEIAAVQNDGSAVEGENHE